MSEIYEELKTYQKELKDIYKTSKTGEFSFRTPLENLLKALSPKGVKPIQEPQKSGEQSHSRPDFEVYKLVDKENELSYNALVGFIECKKLSENLDTHLKSLQIEKYLSISPNIILTNYKRFILLSFDEVIKDVILLDDDLNENEDLFEKFPQRILEFKSLMESFFNDTNTSIKSKDELVKILSNQSFYLSMCFNSICEEKKTKRKTSQTKEANKQPTSHFYDYFESSLETFNEIQKTQMSQLEFCDILAQSIVYGIFVSFLENDIKIEQINAKHFIELLPNSFKTLNEFIYLTTPSIDLPQNILYALENVKKTITLLDKNELSKMLKTELEEICIYLYEDFLKAYDELRATQKRKEGGVFYTPKDIVEMIVSSLHSLLKEKLGAQKGFANNGVKVLDFATGTGSFLASVFEKIIEEEKIGALKEPTIKQKLGEIYGFELSFVPYIVARLKLSLILKKHNYTSFDEKDLQIFLNNTLDLDDTASHKMSIHFKYLDSEWKEAQNIKYSKNLLVILGNPPYNVKSKNKGEKILELLQSYKQGLNETNIQPLDDDYIKFIRFAQWKLLENQNKTENLFKTQKGLLGFITNNSFLSGRTHRKMRECLYKSFDEIYILNLHGSDKDPKDDKNVFDIRVGVCISLFVKYKETQESKAKIYYYSTLENKIFLKEKKFALLKELKDKVKEKALIKALEWQELSLEEPYFWFVPKNLEYKEYESFYALAADKAFAGGGDCKKVIFENFSSGISTSNDKICIQLNERNLENVLYDFQTLKEEELEKKYKIKESGDWKIEKAKKDIQKNQGRIEKIAHRPFDTQFTFYTKKQGFLGRPRFDTMQHFLQGENLGLCFTKALTTNYFTHALATDKITEGGILATRTYIAPLYQYKHENDLQKPEKIPNFTENFKKFCKENKILKHKSPEQILAFIYANLFSLKYRKTYLEYLKIGFPRINFEVDSKTFESFEKIGQELLELHLFRKIPQNSKITLKFLNPNEKPSFKISAMKERFVQNRLYLNENLVLENLSKEVWEFKIGGYEVLKSFLKYRKDYEMSKDETEHWLNICRVVEKTLILQERLENL